MPETPYFSCEDLSLDLGGREVLRNISLELREGEVLGIIGPNGAGKTSLLEILSGRYRPKTGKVYFEGRDINGLSLYFEEHGSEPYCRAVILPKMDKLKKAFGAKLKTRPAVDSDESN